MIERVAILLAAIVPGLLVMTYGVMKTRISPGNESLWNSFMLGCVGALVAAAIGFGSEKLLEFAALSPFVHAGARAVFVAALPEETIKFVILVGAIERHVDARRLQDVIALALGVSIGFATMENFLYLMEPSGWQVMALDRARTAVPQHGVMGLVMGALLTSARLSPVGQRFRLCLALAVPIVLHAAYDFPLFAIKHSSSYFSLGWFALLWLAVLVLSAGLAIILCNRVLPKAADADRLSGRDSTSATSTMPLIIAGCILLLAGLSIGMLSFYLREKFLGLPGAVLSILPVALAIDLICSGWRMRASTLRQDTA